jgi:hypothetical protein
MHKHSFTRHYLIRTSFGRVAWVPVWACNLPIGGAQPPSAFMCEGCGAQGYEVPA